MRVKPPSGRVLCLVFLLFALGPLLFAIYTDNRWEDFYITFRVSKNLVLGHGLVFTEGERIHAFTSPVGVLLPALCSWLAGINHDDAALWLFRAMSISALGLAGIWVFIVLRKRGVSTLVTWTWLILAALDAKTVMFACNGMETAFLILALSVSIYALTVESRWTFVLLGLAWGAAMWVRPDGFVYVGAIALSVLAFKAGVAAERGRGWMLRQFVYAGGLAAVIYLPWFMWAWSYYGTPVPHTVIAKGLHQHLQDALLNIEYYGIKLIILVDIYGPTNVRFGGWIPVVPIWSYLLWILSALLVVLPTTRLTRALSAAFILSSFYLCFIAPYIASWYAPNCSWIGFLALALAFHDFSRDPKTPAHDGILSGLRFPRICLGVAGMAILLQLIILGCVFQQIRAQQRLIEFGQRKQIGLWLGQHAGSPRDTVFVECLGYIGYYSNLKMYDYPGLSSEEVVEVRRKLNTEDFEVLIEALHPDWLVLRYGEVLRINSENSSIFSKDYQLASVFDCSKAVRELSVQGIGYIAFDQTFFVFRRKQ